VTPVANFSPVSATGLANFSTGINYTLVLLVSLTPVANFLPVSLPPVAINGNNIRLYTLYIVHVVSKSTLELEQYLG
jgi:hypothetical protein